MNKIFVYYVLYFVIFVFATFNGIIILKTKSLRSPFQRRKTIEGKNAILIGSVLVIVGLFCLLIFIIGISKIIS